MTTTTTATPTDPVPAADTIGCGSPARSGQRYPRPQRGRVAWFDTEKGFGFLTPETGPAVFVDFQSIDVPGFRTLVAGQPVVFTATDTPRGPEATRVVPCTRADSTPRLLPQPHPHSARQDGLPCRCPRRNPARWPEELSPGTRQRADR
ncbi:cold shock domain-containing protein [Nocardia spumae]|uniref:cold shock domain-containing protein n=1 Tax=Nocardia spumae TaxID=2887190 RepID=UPI0030D97774